MAARNGCSTVLIWYLSSGPQRLRYGMDLASSTERLQHGMNMASGTEWLQYGLISVNGIYGKNCDIDVE